MAKKKTIEHAPVLNKKNRKESRKPDRYNLRPKGSHDRLPGEQDPITPEVGNGTTGEYTRRIHHDVAKQPTQSD